MTSLHGETQLGPEPEPASHHPNAPLHQRAFQSEMVFKHFYIISL